MNLQGTHLKRSNSAGMSDEQWRCLLAILDPYVLKLVRRAHLISWQGQEIEIAQDITFTAIRKLLEYIRGAEQKGIVIGSLERLAYKTAKNQFLDALRKDRRLLRGEAATYALEASPIRLMADDPADFVVEHMHYESLYRQVARLVVRYPAKLRRALIIDFAARIKKYGSFETCPTGLRLAFEEVGIHLEDYLPCIPSTPVLRSRQASLVNLGYKRIVQSIVI